MLCLYTLALTMLLLGTQMLVQMIWGNNTHKWKHNSPLSTTLLGHVPECTTKMKQINFGRISSMPNL